MERFQFLKTYADSINQLAKADENLAKDLLRKIMQYGIYDEDIDTQNPIIEAMFVQIKVMLDNGKEISEKRRKANSQRTNIKQNGTSDEQIKNKKEQKLTNDEQNINKQGTNDEQNEPKDKKENRKDKKENKNITLTSNTETIVSEGKEEYGNPEINLLLEIVKKFNGGLIDGTVKQSRQYGKLLIDKLKKLPSVANGKHTRDLLLEKVLEIISQNKFYSSKIVSVESIYRNLTLLIQQSVKDYQKEQVGNIVLQTV